MTGRTAEIAAVAATVAGCILATVWPFVHEERVVHGIGPDVARVVTLTGVAAAGVWTEDDVNATNYSLSFLPARPLLRLGETVRLRLKSADVAHTFYCPGLGIGPLQVYPGHVAEILLAPAEDGLFDYYCTTACGDPHFRMRGQIAVTQEGKEALLPSPAGIGRYWLESPPAGDQSRVARGNWLYRRIGCVACHGREGRGGVPNWNYVKGTVPSLNTLAERLMLFEPEDVEAVVEALEEGVDLTSLMDDPPVPRFNAVLAQYNSVRDVIRRGNPAGKKDPEGPPPPLEMPAWGQRLSDADIDCLIAYLLTLQTWDDEEDEDAAEEEEP